MIVLLSLLAFLLLFGISYMLGTAKTAALKEEHVEERNIYSQQQADYQKEILKHQVKYEEWIRYYAAVYQLDPAFVAAVIKTESDYIPTAISSKNARGLMQFMPATLEWVGPKFGVKSDDFDALNDPETAIKLGCYLLNYITTQFRGDPILTACAYHAGWGNVNTWLTKYSTDGKTLTIDQIPTSDTRNYARKVLKSYAIYQQFYY